MTAGTFEAGVAAAEKLSPERLRELLVRHYPMERRAKLAEIYKSVPDGMLLDLFGVHVEAWSLGVLMGIQLKQPAAHGAVS